MKNSIVGTAIVTGGSRGIGRAIAQELASMGYNLLLVAKDSNRLKKTAEEISKGTDVKIDLLPCDLSKTADIDALYEFCVSKKIIPDVLVNNAGIYVPGTTKESPIREYDNIMSVNARSMFYLTQKIMPLLKKGHNQRVIVISSVWALDSYPADGNEDGTIYAISKWAVRGWSRSLRAELRKHNIGVSTIYPGAVFTDEWKGTTRPKENFIKPEDIGKVVRAILETSPQTVIEEVILRPIGGDFHE
ncbi:MAG: SDR family oxidoreductase [Candidatus Micrarchaeaceae archaeon]